jgi:CelD/BcsL family acetyltransferase involved in cellulose biosynthesis
MPAETHVSHTHQLEPLTDGRWPELTETHAKASVFHSVGWLQALHETYGYKPIVFTKDPPGARLTNGIVFCRVASWLTGRRLVSLPFSDHCEPLVESPAELSSLLIPAQDELREGRVKYIDIRPVSLEFSEGSEDGETYFLHLLDLRPSVEQLYKKLHGDSIRRKIQRAEREKLALERGSSEELLTAFYGLHVITRQRQQLPPHPLNWFRNVLKCLGEKARICVAKKDGVPIAAILTISHGQKMIYKYGCSDAQLHNLGGMQFLFWDLIRTAKDQGFVELDFGRSECSNTGLVTFKDRWGTQRQLIRYLRYPHRPVTEQSAGAMKMGKEVFARCPRPILRLAGRLLYPHVG